ncbi:AMP-binding-domain-containing protein [Paxillus ammoniavirescens]|nr:AMP-binding-domain-containing protein [Paxillus ammoniavirescens]
MHAPFTPSGVEQMSRTVLHDYTYVQLPDLSDKRVHTVDELQKHEVALDEDLLHAYPDNLSLDALILVAYTHLLGLYCGATDVLICLDTSNDTVSPFRLQWNEHTTWSTAIEAARIAIQQRRNHQIPLVVLQQALGLQPDQCPFVAFFRPSGAIDHTSHLTHPLLLHAEDGLLSLQSSSLRFSPPVSSMLLRQIVTSATDTFGDSERKLATPSRFSDDLAAVVKALPADKRSSYYSHIAPVRIATDYLLPYVNSTPNAAAVQWYPVLSSSTGTAIASECLSYNDLHRSANQFARFLVGRGLCPGDRVAVCMDRIPVFHTIMFGILRAGGCYVPIDPELPTERKIFIAGDSGAKFVVISSQTQPPALFGELSMDVADVSIESAITSMGDANMNSVPPESLAYMLYTSGTTGNPKGCLLTHNGLAEAILALSSFAADVKMNLRAGRYLAIASAIAFDVHIAEIFVPLALGMTLVCARRAELLENLPQHISRLEITHVGLVPSLIDATMCTVEQDPVGEEIKLRYIASGGEKISDSILDKWADHSKVRLVNFYGPSEVTIGCCARFMDSSTPKGNIGRPFANVSSYVVDSNLNILPRGSLGELVVAGPLVGQGYHGRNDLTTKAFLTWPHPGSRAYRTGDLVRMMPDGALEIVGRTDTQIKLRGVRIEAEGISSVLRNAARSGCGFQLDADTRLFAHPSIGNGNTPQLISFVAWDSKVTVATRRTTQPHVIPFEDKLLQILRVACERELASYMRPAHIIPLSWLPLNPNGKADSNALNSVFKEIGSDTLFAIGHDASAGPEKPSSSSPAQQKLVSLVEQRVKGPPIDSRGNLFAYGMDSLSLVQLASDIRKTFTVSISVADIMNRPTIEAISTLLQILPTSNPLSNKFIQTFSEEWLPVVQKSIPHLSIERVLPPFPLQEGVLYHADSHPTSCVQHVIMSISNNTSLSRVRNAWETTMKKLDVLRTVFFFGRQLVQAILTPASCQLPWIEKLTSFENEDSFNKFFFTQDAPSLARQINSATVATPLFRLTVYTKSDGHRVALSIHHALFDGVSLPLILQFVEDELLGRSHSPTCSAEQLLEYVHSADTDAAREFWVTKFSGFDWSTQRSINLQPSSQIRRKAVPLATSLSTLAELLAPHEVTLQSALTCTFASLLAQHVRHNDDVAFGVIRSGRLLPVEGIERAIYPTLTVLPTRVCLNTRGYLLRTQADISAAVQFEQFSLSQVQNWLRRDGALLDTLFAVTVNDDTVFDLWDILQSELPEPDFPLSVEILLDVGNNALVVQCAHYECGSLAVSVDNILDQFESVLLGILNWEERHPSSIVASDVNPVVATHALDDVEDEASEGLGLKDLRPLQATVSQFLGVPLEQIFPSTSFISLGLDSIRSVGLSKVLRQNGYPVTAADIMKHPSLQRLGNLCSRSFRRLVQEEIDQSIRFMHDQCEKLEARVDLSAYKLSVEDEVDLFPTTALQAGMLSQTVATSGILYFHAFVLVLDPKTNISLLHKAWNDAVDHFDILRTTFHYVADVGAWIQARHSVARLDWQDYTPKTSERLQDAIEGLVSLLKPLNESAFRTPSVHLRILRSDPDHLHLVLLMHHALYDGLAVANLLQHVERIYQENEVTPPAQFFDFLPRMLFQQHGATAYWTQRLQNYRPTPLPRNVSVSPKAITASRLISIQRQELAQFVNDNAVTLQCLGQAMWAKFIASLTSSFDVVFGHVVSGRIFDDSEGVVGPMLNTVPCRIQFSPHMSNRDLLRSIHQANVDAIPWQHVSLRAVQKEIQLQSLCSSLFLFQPRTSPLHSDLWALRDSGEFNAQIQYPLNVEFNEVDNGFLVHLACLSDVMDAQTLCNALTEFDQLLNDLIFSPDHPALPAVPATVGVHMVCATDPTPEPNHNLHIPPELMNVLASVAHCPAEKLHPSQSLAGVGIDSITAISLSAKCRQVGLAISVGDIISSRSIGELVSKVNATNTGTMAPQQSPSLLKVSNEERQEIIQRFPERCRSQIMAVSAATEGMKWLIGAWQGSQHSRFQHVFAYRLSPSVDIDQLRKAWKALLAYHPILRSTFASAPGHADPRLVTFAEEGVETNLREERIQDSLDDLLVLAERMKAIISSPTQVTAPQAKGIIIASSSNRYLLIRMHHFQYDAFSLRLLLDDLSAMYNGLTPRSTADPLAFLAAFAPSSTNILAQRSYWQSAMPIPFVPTYFPSLITGTDLTMSPGRTLVTVKSAIPGVISLKRKAREVDLPLHAILLASWASVQARYSSTDHATFGLWHAGRTGSVVDTDRLAVPCMNVLPVHVAVLDDLLQVAHNLQEDLYKRTPLIQQSSLQNVNDWVREGIPLTNVFVNVFEIAREASTENVLLSFVELDHAIPEAPPAEESVIDPLPITKLIQDDIMVDIVINEELDAVTMSVESAPAVLDVTHALEVIQVWAAMVKRCVS